LTGSPAAEIITFGLSGPNLSLPATADRFDKGALFISVKTPHSPNLPLRYNALNPASMVVDQSVTYPWDNPFHSNKVEMAERTEDAPEWLKDLDEKGVSVIFLTQSKPQALKLN